MKRVVEGQCGQQNALVGLATTYGTAANQRIAPSNAATSSLLPSNNLGEQLANEFLRSQANRAASAPTSFSLKSLQHSLPGPSALATNWAADFQKHQYEANRASQWANEYHQSGATSSSAAGLAQQWGGEYLVSSDASRMANGVHPAMLASEYLDHFDKQEGNSSSWAEEFVGGGGGVESDTWTGTHNEKMYEDAWKEITSHVENEQAANYVHQESNPYLTESDPLSTGDLLMRQGDIGNAMLAYEAAVQRNPQDANAWCRLALAHAENEKDQLAIIAFNKSLEIEANNKEALLGLSVSLANEGMENEALHNLDKWLSAHTQSDATQITTHAPVYSSFLDHDTFARVETRFLNTARLQGTEPDADLQNALGILYNLNRNFERAVDSLKLAVYANPEDARLWNRLGATLANGDRTGEAVSAYREALSRYPTYVRARYNLGISCMQLSAFREALDHFLSALDLQKGGNSDSGIWSTMRSAAIRTSDIPDAVLRAIETRDLSAIKSAMSSFM